MRPSKAASYAAAHTAVVGHFQNKHKEARFKAYQATPKKLKINADRMTLAGPQRMHPLTALYLWGTIAPNVLAARSVDMTNTNVAADIDRTSAARQSNQASASSAMHAELSRQVRSPQLRRSDMPSLSRRVIPIRNDDQIIARAKEHNINHHAEPITTQQPTTTTPPMPEWPLTEAEELRVLTLDANQQVITLLRKEGLASASDTAAHLPFLLEHAINFAERNSQSHAMLARYLQKASGRYGAYADEIISLAVQKKIIRNWVAFNLLGQPIEDLIEKKVRDNPPDAHFRGIDIHRYLLHAAFGNVNLSEKLKNWIFQHVLAEEVPMMAYLESVPDLADPDREQLAEMNLNSFEWGQIHAGLRLFRSIDPDTDIGLAAAGELGKILLAQLQESAAPANWWAFFRLPARLRYALVYPDLLPNTDDIARSEIEVQAMTAYVLDHDRQITNQFPLTRLNHYLQQFQSRSELTWQMLRQQCYGMPRANYVEKPDQFCAQEITDRLLFPNWRSTKPLLEQAAHLPDIDQIFQEQIDLIADPYQVVDRALLTAACNTLMSDDLDFLNEAEVKWIKITQTISASDNQRVHRNINQATPLNLANRPLKNIEFFSAIDALGNERIYALAKKIAGYELDRIDTDPEKYKPYFPPLEEDVDYVLHAAKKKNPLKRSAQNLHSLLENMSNQHRKDFSRHLQNYGSQTNNQQSTQSLLLSLIPFYNCVTSAATGAVGTTLINCGMDAIAMAPLIGEFASMSLKLGEILGTGSLMAMRNAAIEVNLGNVLRTSLRPGESDFVRYALLPAAEVLNYQTATTLGMATLRALDPGIELIASLGEIPLRQTIRLGQLMAPSLPQLEKLLGKMETELPPPHVPTSNTNYLLARRQGIYREIPVIQLEGDRYHDRPVYVQINPLSGQPFGRKYVLLEDNVLDPVPLDTARHLRNILTQGMGGRGAIKQASNWAINISELDAPMLRRLQQELTTGADLPTLIQRYELNPDVVSPYLSADGKLTARGTEMLKQADTRASQFSPEIEHVQSPQQAGTSGATSPPAPVPAPSDNAARTITREITFNPDVRRSFMVHDGMITSQNGISYVYDLDLDVFFERRFGASEFAYLPDSEKEGVIPLTMASAYERAGRISDDQRSAVLKALDIDLDITAILNRAPERLPLKQAIPKRISYIWIGNQIFNDELISILKTNCIRANASGFKVHFYLSEQSRGLNYESIATALCSEQHCHPQVFGKNKLKLLENTEFYRRFSASKNFQQYRDAIDGNGGIATNFASAADILRLAILKDKGGLYMDIDDVLEESFGKIKLKASNNGFVLSELLESEMLDMHPEFGTSFLGSQPGNTVIDEMLNEIARRYALPEYRDFYKTARPHPSDKGAMLTYIRKLTALTGPKVFNKILLDKFPDIREFVEMSKLDVLCKRPLASKLRQALIKKTPTPQDITPLAGSSRIGSMHSWRDHRKKRAWRHALSAIPADAEPSTVHRVAE